MKDENDENRDGEVRLDMHGKAVVALSIVTHAAPAFWFPALVDVT